MYSTIFWIVEAVRGNFPDFSRARFCPTKNSMQFNVVFPDNNKRLCNRVGVCIQVEHGGMVTDSAMDTWDASMQQQSVPNSNSGVSINHPASNMVYAVQGSQRCNRCLAGEPGHINHIMGY
ncbi:uncharacterized protein isoform X1 [Salmo salar]|uniref:Uncharacterized protein isoform X1 n=1 Tax=Salmo salar TaxID=8030 RepID=A0ABM3DE43_SALSA|nr:uncharacterized protein LOC106577356 isoform X1 [Salmo salar]